jgi:molybdopterin molybdotransferase
LAELLSVQQAQDRILALLAPVAIESAALESAAGRILAEEVHAPQDMPPFDNSGMDGFAVIAADVAAAQPGSAVTLEIAADIPAGQASGITLRPGQAARIMTGAPLPDGADAVVPVEDTNFAPGLADPLTAASVAVYHPARTGAHIRPRGQDVRAGQPLLRPGRQIQPQDVGMLASTGKPEVRVYRRPRVGLFSSGDELVKPGLSLGPGQIYDSNGTMLAAMLESEGAQVVRLGTARDDPRQIAALLDGAVRQQVDLIVTSAGVSVGAFDFVRQVIETHGSLNFWRVNMRPGKPLAFGSYEGIPVIGLPGNPVSAFVGCRVFVLPALYKLSGREQAAPHRECAILVEPLESDGRESYLRAVVQRDPETGSHWSAKLTGHQGSGNLYSLIEANALLIVPSGVKSLPSGSEVEIWFLDHS